MKTVFDDQNLLLQVSEELSMIKVNWKTATVDMSDEKFQELGC